MDSLTEYNARAYVGPERRRNQVLVTRNSEYHCRDGACVGVRDRRTQICFSSCDGDLAHDVITSPLVDVKRPSTDLT